MNISSKHCLTDEELDNVFHTLFKHDTILNRRMLLSERDNKLIVLVQDDDRAKLNIPTLYEVSVLDEPACFYAEHEMLQSFIDVKDWIKENKSKLLKIHEFWSNQDIFDDEIFENMLKELK